MFRAVLHCSTVALFYRDTEYFTVESVVKHGPNVMSCVLVSGRMRQPLVGVYIPPTDTTVIDSVVQALNRFGGSSTPPVLMGDLNCNLDEPRSDREVQIAAAISAAGLDDMLPTFGNGMVSATAIAGDGMENDRVAAMTMSWARIDGHFALLHSGAPAV